MWGALLIWNIAQKMIFSFISLTYYIYQYFGKGPNTSKLDGKWEVYS